MTTHSKQTDRGFGWRVGATLVALVTLVLGLVFTQTQAFADAPAPKPESQHLVAARKAIEANDFKSAVGQLTEAVQENPKDVDAHTLLGYSYRKLDKFDKSLEHYRMALKIDSYNRSAQEYLGELYLETNQLPKAEKQLQALKKACPFFGKCEEYNDLKLAVEKYKMSSPRLPVKR
jgi:Flp pilus assembly protein TadD